MLTTYVCLHSFKRSTWTALSYEVTLMGTVQFYWLQLSNFDLLYSRVSFFFLVTNTLSIYWTENYGNEILKFLASLLKSTEVNLDRGK